MRAGLKHIIIPKLNEKDLPDIPPEVKKKLTFTLADNVDEVLAAALEHKRTAPHARRTPEVARPSLDGRLHRKRMVAS